MKNNLLVVLSMTLISSLSVGCKKESIESISEKNSTRSHLSGNCGYGKTCRNQESKSSDKQSKGKSSKGKSSEGKKTDTVSPLDLSLNSANAVRHNSIFAGGQKDISFSNKYNGNYEHTYITYKPIAKKYSFVIYKTGFEKQVSSGKDYSQQEMLDFGRDRGWSNDDLNKIAREDY